MTEPLLTTFRMYRNWEEYAAAAPWNLRPHRLAAEFALAAWYEPERSLPGYCACCAAPKRFSFQPAAQGGAMPNWREELACETCGLISRVRCGFDFLRTNVSGQSRLYLTEQATRAFAWSVARYRDAVGSEFLAGKPPEAVERLQTYLTHLTGSEKQKLRHEDVTALSFDDASFDAVVSFEVLEHVPVFERALAEFRRILRPGGTLLISVPFAEATQESLLRARLGDDGNVEHLAEPEYHGDPTDAGGCLAFHTFGWRLLDALNDAGFRDASLLDAWSPASAYLGFFGMIVARG